MVKKMNDTTQKWKLWEVYILPNNQPAIELGDYYAVSKESAMEMAAVDNMTKVDENWGANLKNE